jgi:hypothetical protein
LMTVGMFVPNVRGESSGHSIMSYLARDRFVLGVGPTYDGGMNPWQCQASAV